MWSPIPLDELEKLIAQDLADCSDDQRTVYARTAITPRKWSQSPHGDLGGGFWAIAVSGSKVLWYNDIEDGFNVSRFDTHGRIPADEYWCNEDPLGLALLNFVDGIGCD